MSARSTAGATRRHLRRWLVGWLLASLLMIPLSRPFLDCISPHAFDPAIGRRLPPAGHRHRFRSEGWTTSVFGRHGVAGVPDFAAAPGPRVGLWGDSFVAAAQLPDPDKPAQRLTSLWRERHATSLLAVGIGEGRRTVADCVELLPRYEAVADFACHFLVISTLDDLRPDGRTYFASPVRRLAPGELPSPLPRARRVLSRMGCDYLWRPLWSFWGERRDPLTRAPLRWRPGPVGGAGPAAAPRSGRDAAADEADWDFLVAALRRATRRPLVIVYAPRFPRVAGGEVMCRDPDGEAVTRLSALCARHDIGFLDLTPAFARHYRQTGRLPHGFANSVPGNGHLNAAGAGVFAAALCAHLEERHADAVHPD